MLDGFRTFLEKRFTDTDVDFLRRIEGCTESLLIGRDTSLNSLLEDRDILFLENGAMIVTDIESYEPRHLFLMEKNDLLVNVFESGGERLNLEIRPAEASLVSIFRYRRMLSLQDPDGRVSLLYLSLFEHVVATQWKLKGIFLRERARGRYETLLTDYSSLFQHFRLKDIACFLGMSPVSLSRLRRQI